MVDWYDYLTPAFKLARKSYKVSEKAAVTCPECSAVDLVRLNNLKNKIERLGFYECAKCLKAKSIQRARLAFKDKHGEVNPYELEASKLKIKESLLKSHGVTSMLLIPEVRELGVISAASEESRAKAKATQLSNHGAFNLDLNRDSINLIFKDRAKALRLKWKRDGEKLCTHCGITKPLSHFTSIKFECSKCKVCNSLYFNEYSQIRKSLKFDLEILDSALGCTIPEFSDYIESQFEPGMSWDNWSKTGWHLDHIIPNKFISDETRFIINNFQNFRPMWAKDNLSKNSRTPEVILLAGCFGSGKSTISSLVSDKFTVLDKDLKHDIYDVARCSLDRPVIYQSAMGVVKDFKTLSQFFKVTLVVIQEPISVVESRIILRGGTFKESTVSNRIKRMLSISNKYGSFTGSADDCLEFLRSI